MHEQYPKRVNETDVDHQMANQWSKTTGLKSELEGFIIAAQDQLLSAQFQKTIDHIVAGCPELAKTEYLHRHNKAATYLH